LVGSAGWALPRAYRRRFPSGGASNLTRYAARFPAVEINSSFYRPHRPSTYAGWAAAVPAGFRFSVKIPKQISHELKLAGTGPALDSFLAGIEPLGAKLGCLLLQLPPSLAYDARTAQRFFGVLRRRYTGPVAAEPRHSSWFTAEANRALIANRIGRVAADPPRVEGGDAPAGWPGLVYFRLHGSPVIYRSSYEAARLAALGKRLKACERAEKVWCIFDNTMLGAATANGLDLMKRLAARR
jgi:uncharacterized protein YecE (DUF72 family)